MKMLCLLCVLFAAAAFQPSSTAQGFGAGNSIDTLHANITKAPYTYIKGTYNLTIKFKGNGTGEGTDWKFKWHSKDAQTIEMVMLKPNGQPSDKKTILTFSADYSSFTGTDFDEVSKVSGHIATAQ